VLFDEDDRRVGLGVIAAHHGCARLLPDEGWRPAADVRAIGVLAPTVLSTPFLPNAAIRCFLLYRGFLPNTRMYSASPPLASALACLDPVVALDAALEIQIAVDPFALRLLPPGDLREGEDAEFVQDAGDLRADAGDKLQVVRGRGTGRCRPDRFLSSSDGFATRAAGCFAAVSPPSARVSPFALALAAASVLAVTGVFSFGSVSSASVFARAAFDGGTEDAVLVGRFLVAGRCLLGDRSPRLVEARQPTERRTDAVRPAVPALTVSSPSPASKTVDDLEPTASASDPRRCP
jgi:hypothetical protein